MSEINEQTIIPKLIVSQQVNRASLAFECPTSVMWIRATTRLAWEAYIEGISLVRVFESFLLGSSELGRSLYPTLPQTATVNTNLH
jgi:hypothetical protein